MHTLRPRAREADTSRCPAKSIRLAQAAVLLVMCAWGCARVTSDKPVSQPQPAAPAPTTPTPAARPAARATPKPAPATASAPKAESPAPSAARKVAPPAAAPPSTASQTLDLNALTERLKETKAIGIFTKITLKNQVDDLLQQFSDFYKGKRTFTMPALRRSYDLLMMKVLSLLQDTDQKLASAIVSSREAIWGLLSDRDKFAALQS